MTHTLLAKLSIFFLSTILYTSTLFGAYIRGTNSDWQPVPMNCISSYGFGTACKAIITFEKEAEFIFDVYGDESIVYGNSISQRKFSPELGYFTAIPEETNRPITLEGNKTYEIFFRNWDMVYGIKEINPIPNKLPENIHILKKKISLIRGQHGNLSVKGELLVRNLSYHKKVGILYTQDKWKSSKIVYANYAETIDSENDTEIWTFNLKGCEKIEMAIFYTKLDNDKNEETTYWDNNSDKNFILQ